MITQTSKLAYKDIQQNGTSLNQKGIILKAVSINGSSLKEISATTGIEINAVSGRVNDLKKEGKLKTTDKRRRDIRYTKTGLSRYKKTQKKRSIKRSLRLVI